MTAPRAPLAEWRLEHRVRLIAIAVGLALVGAAMVLDAAESRGGEIIERPPASKIQPSEGLAALTPATIASRPAAAEPGAFQMPRLESYGEVLERPLFAPDRRPRQAAKETAAPPLPFVLRGIVVQPLAQYALVEEGSPAVTKRVSKGASLGGGVVTDIQRDRIVLDINGSAAVVRLFAPSKANGQHAPVLPTGGLPSQLPPESALGQYTRPTMSGG